VNLRASEEPLLVIEGSLAESPQRPRFFYADESTVDADHKKQENEEMRSRTEALARITSKKYLR